jgi:hypothetical protein
VLGDLRNAEKLSTIKSYLEQNQVDHYHELFGEDEERWTTVHHNPDAAINDWLRGSRPSELPRLLQPRPIATLLHTPLSEMMHEERISLYHYWIRGIKEELSQNFVSASQTYNDARRDLSNCHNEINLRCLQQAHVIGVTTTGLAKNLNLLRRLSSKVLLCEEAGEVLESHILTGMLLLVGPGH